MKKTRSEMHARLLAMQSDGLPLCGSWFRHGDYVLTAMFPVGKDGETQPTGAAWRFRLQSKTHAERLFFTVETRNDGLAITGVKSSKMRSSEIKRLNKEVC